MVSFVVSIWMHQNQFAIPHRVSYNFSVFTSDLRIQRIWKLVNKANCGLSDLVFEGLMDMKVKQQRNVVRYIYSCLVTFIHSR